MYEFHEIVLVKNILIKIKIIIDKNILKINDNF